MVSSHLSVPGPKHGKVAQGEGAARKMAFPTREAFWETFCPISDQSVLFASILQQKRRKRTFCASHSAWGLFFEYFPSELGTNFVPNSKKFPKILGIFLILFLKCQEEFFES